MRSRDELGARLRRALSHDVAEARRETHLEALRAAVDARRVDGHVAAPAARSSLPLGRPLGRRLVVGAAAATLLLPSAAFASRGALPGEALYPVKRATESLQVVFDAEVVARHRLEELAALLAADAPPDAVAAALDRAEIAAAELPAGHHLLAVLEELREDALRVILGDAAEDDDDMPTAPAPVTGDDEGDDDDEGRSGPGGGGDEDDDDGDHEDRSGPGGGGDGDDEGDDDPDEADGVDDDEDRSGPGGGGEETATELEEDRSGPGGGDTGLDGDDDRLEGDDGSDGDDDGLEGADDGD